MDYQVPLLVLDDNKLLEVPLINLKLTPSGLDYLVCNDTFFKLWPWDETTYGPYCLANSFLADLTTVNRLFEPVIAQRDNFNLLETILSTKVTFAVENAYLQKRKEEEFLFVNQSVGEFYEKEGVLVRLQDSLNEVSSTITHEFGHALHYQLYPQSYSQSTIIAKEMVAIHVARSLGFKKKYSKEKPHYKALQILRNLDNHIFKKMSFKQQWELLIDLTNHQNFKITPKND